MKEESGTAAELEQLQRFLQQAEGEIKEEIERQMKILQYGQYGEQCIAFELKNSGMDMYILHDLYIECGEQSAQIDYIIVTRKRIYVLECKNLIGNVEVDSSGNFIRTYELAGKKIKEGFYSPITQNQRHLQVIKELALLRRKNIIAKAMFEKDFEKYYKSLIVLSNPKTFLNARYAKKDVKEKIIRADQLIVKIKEMDAMLKEEDMSADTMKNIAESLLRHHKENPADYLKKFEERIRKEQIAKLEGKENSENKSDIVTEIQEEKKQEISLNKEELIKVLKTFRLETSRAEGIKPYFIFNDAQMQDLIEKNPKNSEELMQVSGFGKVKAEKYGAKILEILSTEMNENYVRKE